MQLPESGSYQIIRPLEIPEVNWDTAWVGGVPSSSASTSIKADWESGDYNKIHGYIQIGLVTGAEATYSALHIQQAMDQFSEISFGSGYNMSGSLLWKDNEEHHPFT